MAKTEYTVLKRIIFTCFTLTFLLCACQRERHAPDVADDRVFVKADTVWYPADYPEADASFTIVQLTDKEMAWQRGGTTFSRGSYSADYMHFVNDRYWKSREYFDPFSFPKVMLFICRTKRKKPSLPIRNNF